MHSKGRLKKGQQQSLLAAQSSTPVLPQLATCKSAHVFMAHVHIDPTTFVRARTHPRSRKAHHHMAESAEELTAQQARSTINSTNCSMWLHVSYTGISKIGHAIFVYSTGYIMTPMHAVSILLYM